MDAVLDSELMAGAPLHYRSPDGERVFVVGRVVDVNPPRLLSHTQKLTMRDDPWTLVTRELSEVDGGTKVTVCATRTGPLRSQAARGRQDLEGHPRSAQGCAGEGQCQPWFAGPVLDDARLQVGYASGHQAGKRPRAARQPHRVDLSKATTGRPRPARS